MSSEEALETVQRSDALTLVRFVTRVWRRCGATSCGNAGL
jgi:hypothetical protein